MINYQWISSGAYKRVAGSESLNFWVLYLLLIDNYGQKVQILFYQNRSRKMKKVTVATYKEDKYYFKIVEAFSEILNRDDVVTPIEVFIRIGNLSREDVEDWRFGRVSCLETVIKGNLSKRIAFFGSLVFMSMI